MNSTENWTRTHGGLYRLPLKPKWPIGRDTETDHLKWQRYENDNKDIRPIPISRTLPQQQDTAYNEWLRTFEYGWDSDNRNTLEAFESVFKVKVNDWSYDTCRYSYRFTSRYSGKGGTLRHAAKYIVNNYWHILFKPKTYYLKGNFNKKKNEAGYSRITVAYWRAIAQTRTSCDPSTTFWKPPTPEPLCTTSWTSALTASSSRAVTIWNTSAAKRVLRRVAQPTTTSFGKRKNV